MTLVLLLILSGRMSAGGQPPPKNATTSVARLPARIAADFRRLGTKTPLLTLAAGGAAAAAAHPADAVVVRRIGSSGLNRGIFDVGAEAGDGFVQSGAAAAVYAIGLASGSPRTQAVGSALLESQIVEGVIAQGLKYTVPRKRPDGGHYSFPSGHASATFATADVLLQRFGWKAGLPAYSGAVWIAVSRVAQRQHYLSDVIAGAAIGIASARAIDVHAGRQHVAAVPMAVPHGAAILLVVSSR